MRSKPSQRQEQKVYVSFEDSKKYNLIGRLLGPKGLTLKRIQGETQTKMSILGRGSIRDRAKEEELRNSGDPTYAHLSDSLHVLVESIPPGAVQKLAAGVAEVRKMLIPPEPGQPDFASKYDSDMMPMGGPMGPPSSFSHFGEGRGRGGGPSSRGGRGRGGGPPGLMRGRGGRGGRGRGGPPRGGQGGSPNGGRGGMRGGPPRGRFDSPMPRGPPPPRGPPHDSMDYKHGFRDGHNEGFPERRDDYGPPSSGGDPFYSSFSDNPENNDSGEWMGGRHNRRDYRPHPYY